MARWTAALTMAAMCMPATPASLQTDIAVVASSYDGENKNLVVDNSGALSFGTATSSGVSAIGKVFDATASASWSLPGLQFSTEQYGVMRLEGSAAGTGYVQTSAYSRIIVRDELLFSDPVLTGQSGLATFRVVVAGNLRTSNEYSVAGRNGAETFWTYIVGVEGSPASALYLSERQSAFRAGWTTTTGYVNDGFGGPYGAFDISVPFIWGEEIRLGIEFTGNSIVSGLENDTSAAAAYQLGNSVYWGGLTNLETGGSLVTDFALQSTSGFDYSRSFAPVPEPTTLMLVAVGLVLLASMRKRAGPVMANGPSPP
jgi:hypothetical protein